MSEPRYRVYAPEPSAKPKTIEADLAVWAEAGYRVVCPITAGWLLMEREPTIRVSMPHADRLRRDVSGGGGSSDGAGDAG